MVSDDGTINDGKREYINPLTWHLIKWTCKAASISIQFLLSYNIHSALVICGLFKRDFSYLRSKCTWSLDPLISEFYTLISYNVNQLFLSLPTPFNEVNLKCALQWKSKLCHQVLNCYLLKNINISFFQSISKQILLSVLNKITLKSRIDVLQNMFLIWVIFKTVR